MDKLRKDIADDLPEGMALQILARAPFALVLTDPRRADDPIVYVNQAFERTTGYSRAAVLGRNCRFLQGPGTDAVTVRRIGDALAESREVNVDILNYRADGTPFWNRLMIAPLIGPDGAPQYLLGVQRVLGADPLADDAGATDIALREIQHRVKNHLAMIVSLIRMQSRDVATPDSFDTMARRVESLQLLYDELSHREGENRDAVALGAYLGRVANAIAHIDGRSGVRVNVDVDAFTVPMQTAVQLGLILSEVLTNALQHAFAGRDTGLVTTSVHESSDGGIRVRIEDDGIGLPEGSDWSAVTGLGGRIVSQLAGTLGARLVVDSGPGGTSFTLDVPRAARGTP